MRLKGVEGSGRAGIGFWAQRLHLPIFVLRYACAAVVRVDFPEQQEFLLRGGLRFASCSMSMSVSACVCVCQTAPA